MKFARRSWGFALLYVAVSLGVEFFLLVVVRLKIPRDNAVLGPIVLTVPPLLAAWIAGCRRWREFAWLAGAAGVLTLVFTVLGERLTGLTTGLALPIVVRGLAGFVAAALANRVGARGVQS